MKGIGGERTGKRGERKRKSLRRRELNGMKLYT